MQAILLAAGVGRRFGKKTKKSPKCLIPIDERGSTLLKRYLDAFRFCGIRRVTIVVGHQKAQIFKACRVHGKGLNIRFITNPRYREGSLVSLFCAAKALRTGALIMDADVYFPAESLKKFLRQPNKTAFLIDPRSRSAGEEMMLMAKNGRPVHIAKKIEPSLKILGEATGIFKVNARHGRELAKILGRFVKEGRTRVEYEESYSDLMKKNRVTYEAISGFWTEMDFEEDLEKIRKYERSRL